MAGKIYVTGDTHCKFYRFDVERFPEQKELDKDDYVIICGDFGLIWDKYQDAKPWEKEDDRGVRVWESREERWWLDWFEKKPFTVLFVDGNHENFDRLNRYNVEEWKGGKVHKLRSSVIHLMRGQVYEIAGKRIFTFGGARSHDISGGILEPDDPYFRQKKRELDRKYICYRVNHMSWWKEEMPSREEMEEGLRNLTICGKDVDYIISHCGPGELQERIAEHIKDRDFLTDYFDTIRKTVKYNKWYFGHYHKDEDITEKETVLYRGVIKLGEGAKKEIPKLGNPRFKTNQVVGFYFGDTLNEKIGIIASCDEYGSFSVPDEPSYDIWSEHDGVLVLFKHFPETAIRTVANSEIEDKNLIERLLEH